MSQNNAETRFAGGNTAVQTPNPGGTVRVGSTVTIPANTSWEVTSINIVHTVGANPGQLVLRDTVTTTLVYAQVDTNGVGDTMVSDSGNPIGDKIGPFTEEKTLEVALIADAAANQVTASGIARIQQIYG